MIFGNCRQSMDDYFHDIDGFADDEVEGFVGANRPAMRERVGMRFNPLELPDIEFKKRYRFSKNSVENHLVPLLYPTGRRAEDGRGFPFTPVQVVIISFSHIYTVKLPNLEQEPLL